MAPLPLADPDSTTLLNTLFTSFTSLFKSKPSVRRPIFATSPEGIDSIELKDQSTPSFPPSTTPPSDPPAVFELKPAGPEKDPWLNIPGLKNSDDYDELVSNRWNYNRKRTVQGPEPLVGAQQLGEEYRLTYGQELSLTVFIFIITTSASVAAFSAGSKIQGKMHHRLDYYLEGLREDQRVYEGFYVGIFCILSLFLWISLLWATLGLRQLLEYAIWG